MPRTPTVKPGQRYGRMTVASIIAGTVGPYRQCVCRCSCGTVIAVLTNNLLKGNTRSCGCLRRETARAKETTHGRTATRAYQSWSGMKDRCTNPKSKAWGRYGGRGITVCRRWLHSFAAFHADLGDPPPGTSLDRIENDKGYWCGKPECPECGPLGRTPNCRWATPTTQSRNRSNGIVVTHDGRTQHLAAWAEEVGVSYITLYRRIYCRGWDIGRALTTPIPGKRRGRAKRQTTQGHGTLFDATAPQLTFEEACPG